MFSKTPAQTSPAWNADAKSALQVVSLCAALALSSCGKDEPKRSPTPESKPSAAKVSDTELDAHIADALTPPPPEPIEDNARDAFAEEAERIMDMYPEKNAQDLLGVPEVNAKLVSALKKLGADKALQDYINSSVDIAAQITGLEGGPGTYGLNLDLKVYDAKRTSRMLQNVLTEDPRRLVDFLAQEIGEATADLSYGGVSKSPNGISLVPKNPPPAAASKPPEP
ncbi:MAG: hypothetical protein H7A55_14875 [Verrucomicrobiaceae bacterium]|nr:hypothetical protein [Verrucomicrobiaceae bacterium]